MGPRQMESYGSLASARAGSVLTPQMEEQSEGLNELADILPQASKQTLAVYLQNADNDQVAAISAYLEDERKGLV